MAFFYSASFVYFYHASHKNMKYKRLTNNCSHLSSTVSLKTKCSRVVKTHSAHAQIIYYHTVYMFKRAGRLQCGSDEVRTAGKQTTLCYTETNPTQVSVLNTFLSAQFTNKGADR